MREHITTTNQFSVRLVVGGTTIENTYTDERYAESRGVMDTRAFGETIGHAVQKALPRPYEVLAAAVYGLEACHDGPVFEDEPLEQFVDAAKTVLAYWRKVDGVMKDLDAGRGEGMITSKVIEGLQILQKYRDDDGYDLGAEHDVLYAYATDRPLEPDDIRRMIELGWFQERENYDNDFAESDYDFSEGWQAFV